MTQQSPFGRWFAGEQRHLPSFEDPEPNTEDENKVVRTIMDWQDGSGLFPSNVVDMILAAQKFHPQDLKPPPGTLLFRGLRFSGRDSGVEWVRQHLTNGEVPTVGRVMVSTPKEHLVVRPKGADPWGVQSWTSDKRIAMLFAHVGRVAVGASAVLVTSTDVYPNTFLFAPGMMSQVTSGFDNEMETLSIGPVRVSRVVWYISNDLPSPDEVAQRWEETSR